MTLLLVVPHKWLCLRWFEWVRINVNRVAAQKGIASDAVHKTAQWRVELHICKFRA